LSVSNEDFSAGAAVERLSVEPIPPRPRRASGSVTPIRPNEPETAAPAAVSPQYDQMILQLRARIESVERKGAVSAALEARSHMLEQISATLNAVMRVLAVRFQLLLALCGAFGLALGAMAWQSTAGLLILIAWCILTIFPLALLEWGGRPRR
jgi:hypothetical protein